MAEVCIECEVQREGSRVGIKCRVGRRAVVDRRVGQAGEKLIDVADALGWTKRALAPTALSVSASDLDTTNITESCSPSLVVLVDVAVVLEVGEDAE